MFKAFALAGLIFSSGQVTAPAVDIGTRIATNILAETNEENLSSQLFSELSDSGIDVNDPKFASTPDGQPEFLNLVEWAYSAGRMAEGYTLYLYIFNKGKTQWNLTQGATVSMAFLKGEELATDVEEYRTYSAKYVSKTMDDRFIKLKIVGGTDMYRRVDSKKRRYLIGSLFLTEKTTGKNKSFPMGWEASFTGEGAKDTSSVSTLTGTLSPTRSLRIEATPVTSTVAQGMITSKDGYYTQSALVYQNSNGGRSLSSLNYFSTVFSLPQEVNQYGELESVHYQYYKYRSNWIVQAISKGMNPSNANDYEQLSPYSGVYLADDASARPDPGFQFFPYFDLDEPNVDLTKRYDLHFGFERFFNNTSDAGHHELRIRTLGLVYPTKDLPGFGGQDISGNQIAEDLRKKTASSGVPVMNGYINPNYVYVPSYSRNEDYYRYGFNDRRTSKDNLSGTIPASVLNNRMTYYMNDGTAKSINWGSEAGIDWKMNGTIFNYPSSIFGTDFTLHAASQNPALYDWFDLFKKNIQKSDSTAYDHLWGDEQDKLLKQLNPSSYADDWILSKASVGYGDSLNKFVNDNKDKNLYRLTYDFGLSNVYKATAGKRNTYDGLWNANESINIGKTDVIFDFTFIDMTFKDENGRLYTLPVANHPFSQSGGQENPPVTVDGNKIAWWIWAIVAVVALFLIGLVGKYFKPVGVGLMTVIKIVLWIPYIVIVFPIAKLARKDLPAWPFK